MKCRADFRRFSQIWENTQPGGATLSQSIHFEVQARTRALTESLEQQTATSEVFERPDRVQRPRVLIRCRDASASASPFCRSMASRHCT
jgi:hypothetical protein